MTSKLGKVNRSFLDRAVLRHLGAQDRRVLTGPAIGLDNVIIRLGGKKVLIVTSDPISIIPSIGIETSAWLSVHLIASDFATSGNDPEFATFDLNVPAEVGDDSLETYLKALGKECKKLGVAIVAGNTGRYPGAGLTVVGGGTMFGTAPVDGYLLSSMARTGDDIVMTKGAAVETTGALAQAFPKFVRRTMRRGLASRAEGYVRLCSVVQDARIASRVGRGGHGVSAMHDATEGGVLGGLDEMARASGRDFVVDTEAIYVSPETAGVCSAFGIDPLVSLSEGTLLVTSSGETTGELLRKLHRSGIKAAVIGEVGKEGGRLLIRSGGKEFKPFASRQDPYWDAYLRGVGEGLT